jgi:tetratricopeptide (TPR) repeat protein
MPVYALTIFTGAFLLFLVQPLIGKYILPWFGGAPAVWTTCMLFFQMLLLCGYAYAHFSARWLKPRTQAITQLALLITTLALLHITPSDSWKPTDSGNPTLRILGLLIVSIGLPYFVLASTSPLMQHWFSRTNPGVSPFRLYALSNVGSLLALISFPVFFETRFTRKMQAMLWGCGLVVYALSCGLCALKLWRTPAVEKISRVAAKATTPDTTAPTLTQNLLWLLLPACASTLLLATTNMICQEVAVIPFLWVLPLSLYLLSFIICFDSPRWYLRFPFALALIAALSGICWIVFQGIAASMYLQLGVYLAGLFICCMVCHGELYRLRPDPRHLTGFYLMIAAGGALGGLFVAIVAPLIFNDYYELHWGLFLCGLLFLIICLRERNPGSPKKKGEKRFSISARQRTAACAVLAAGLAALGIALWVQAHTQLPPSGKMADSDKEKHPYAKTRVERSRNFYGVLAVFQHDAVDLNTHLMEFTHGRTLHGLQFTDPERARWPTAYFSEISGIGMTLDALPAGNRRIGVVGLGAGTLAAYPRAGDYMHMYEINPEVLRLASKWFTYLTNCQGRLEITLGDARLSLEKEPPQNFDLLVLDAFNSDAPPVHLLTREAFTIYERHLKPGGMIAVNVSNRRINLDPVIANLAREFHYQMVIVDNPAPHDKSWIMSASWALLARDESGEKIINSPAIQLASRPPLTNAVSIPLWTDDFASLFQIIRSDSTPQSDPAFTDTECQIAFALYQQGDFAGAIARFRHALKTLPHSPVLLSNLAFLLTACPDTSLRNVNEATRLAETACQLTHYHTPAFLSTLAVIYSESDRFPEAILMAEKACALASESGEQALLQKNQELLVLYRAHRPFHEFTSPAQTEPATLQQH